MIKYASQASRNAVLFLTSYPRILFVVFAYFSSPRARAAFSAQRRLSSVIERVER